MKKMKCDMCEVELEGEDFDAWFKAAQAHYGIAHPEVMKDTSKTKEEGEKWMTDAKARFENSRTQ